MSRILVSNDLSSQVTIAVPDGQRLLKFSNHLELLRQMVDISDECLLVSPFLFDDFGELLEGLDLSAKEVELVSSFAPWGADQLTKPFRLRSFGIAIRQATGSWPAIGLTRNLHSKIYVFLQDGAPLAGVVTSANLTHAGMVENHETGILIVGDSEDDRAVILQMAEVARHRQNFPNLRQQDVDLMCAAVERWLRQCSQPPDTQPIDIGLGNVLQGRAAPGPGNPAIPLRNGARYFIKVAGKAGSPVLAVPEEARSQNMRQLASSTPPPRLLQLGDCLIEHGVGSQSVLAYYACASQVNYRSQTEQDQNEHHRLYPYYIHANNLSLDYGTHWYQQPLEAQLLQTQFLAQYPGLHVTEAGGDSYLGAVQRGKSYVQVTEQFGQFVTQQIDAWALPP